MSDRIEFNDPYIRDPDDPFDSLSRRVGKMQQVLRFRNFSPEERRALREYFGYDNDDALAEAAQDYEEARSRRGALKGFIGGAGAGIAGSVALDALMRGKAPGTAAALGGLVGGGFGALTGAALGTQAARDRYSKRLARQLLYDESKK